MKRWKLLLVTSLMAVALCAVAYAGVTDFDAVRMTASPDDTYQVQVKNSSGTSKFTVDSSGNVIAAGTLNVTGATTLGTAGITTGNITTATITTLNHSRERSFGLPLTGFVTSDGYVITQSTAPGIEIDDVMPNIVWADGETTPAIITFRIPADYSSGGAFRVFATESDSTTPNQIDFDVYVNSNGAAADSSATGQTPVAMTGTTPEVVTLTPATDFSSLAAGYWVTLRIWRDNAADGTGDLEVKGVDFFYTATN